MQRSTYAIIAGILGTALLTLNIHFFRTDRIALSWEHITERAEWTPRDSAIALVFNGRMWLMGGWTGLGLPTPTDVWSSSDGAHWKQVLSAAPWRNGDAAMAISFKGEIWLVGGVSDPRQRDEAFSNEIWSSVDGEKWTYHGHAAWSPRVGAALVTLSDKMWL